MCVCSLYFYIYAYSVCAVMSVCMEVSVNGFMCVHTHIFLCVDLILCECDRVVLSRIAACVHGSMCA